MLLPILVEDQNDLPDGFENLYQENKEGKYVLQVEGVDNHPDVHGLKSAYQKEKEKRQKFSKDLENARKKASLIPDDVDEDTINELLEKIKARQNDPDGDGDPADDPGDNEPAKKKAKQKDQLDYQKMRDQIEKRFKKDMKELSEQLSEKEKTVAMKDQKIRKLIINNELTVALQKNKVTNPIYQKAAKRLLEDQIKIQEDDNGDLVPIVETDMGETSLENFVRDWTAGDEGSEFVDGNSGSGARGAGNKGPKGKKEISREQFDNMSAPERMAFFKNGGRIVD